MGMAMILTMCMPIRLMLFLVWNPKPLRLYTIFPKCEKLYAVSYTQCSSYAFRFLDEESMQLKFFAVHKGCTEGENRYLDCIPGGRKDSSYLYMYLHQDGGVHYSQTRGSGRRVDRLYS